MKVSIVGALAGALLLGACAPYSAAPVVTNFPSQEQQKLQAASHWQVIAQDAARDLVSSLPERRPVFVAPPSSPSIFEQAFTRQLNAALVRSGYPVAVREQGPDVLVVNIHAQAVRFSADRPQYSYNGSATTLAGGAWVLRNVVVNVSPGAGMMAAAVGFDAHRWFSAKFATGQTPRTELMLDVSVADRNFYLAHVSNVYYTTDAETDLYQHPDERPADPSLPRQIVPIKGGA